MGQDNRGAANRNIWKSTREQNRMKARFAIRERVANDASSSSSCEGSPSVDPGRDEKKKNSTVALIGQALQRILDNDKSYFSLTTIQSNIQVFDSEFDAKLLFEEIQQGTSVAKMIGAEKLVSWYGPDGFGAVQKQFESLQTTTLIEVACLFTRHAIVGSLLLGGVNPCVRGKLKAEFYNDWEDALNWHDKQVNVGRKILGLFFDPVPLSLQTYLVKRNFEFRRLAMATRKSTASSEYCAKCQRDAPISVQLRMDSGCNHFICEFCFWEDVLTNLKCKYGDVASCCACNNSIQTSLPLQLDGGTPHDRLLYSRQKYYDLPKNSTELKKRKLKPKKRPVLVSTWGDAALLSVGNTQDVRSEKFFSYIMKGTIHFVRACLKAGVDLNLQNEYGQSGLYLAAWRGHEEIVQLLLDYGSGPDIPSNDRTTALDAARQEEHGSIVCILSKLTAVAPATNQILSKTDIQSEITAIHATTLIPCHDDCAGAGSYVIDNVLTKDESDQLVAFWAKLPTEQSKTKALCSVRSYWCDTFEYVTFIIKRALLLSSQELRLQSARVLPFMRFLSYESPGTSLAPHVDLTRVDFKTGKRSTHSFLLYLTDCRSGGETTLLKELNAAKLQRSEDNIVGRVEPKLGRLLLFPHICPHQGEAVVDVPKLLIRGEVILESF